MTDEPDDPLRALLKEGADPAPTYTGADIRSIRRRQRAASVVGAVAVVVLGLFLLRPEPESSAPELRPRGVDTGPPPTLEVLLDQPGAAPVPLAGAAVPTDGAVVFLVRTPVPASLCIEEELPSGWTQILPPPGSDWRVEAGEHAFTIGAKLATFRTDAGAGPRRYRASTGVDCVGRVSADVVVHWEE